MHTNMHEAFFNAKQPKCFPLQWGGGGVRLKEWILWCMQVVYAGICGGRCGELIWTGFVCAE